MSGSLHHRRNRQRIEDRIGARDVHVLKTAHLLANIQRTMPVVPVLERLAFRKAVERGGVDRRAS
jgi:hypothetical protein